MIYLKLFYTFLKIGLFTFGGGYAMLPLIQEEVIRHGWLSIDELVDFIAVSESTPGPFGVNVSTYVGIETGGMFGAFCSTLGVVLPSFIIILITARYFDRFKSNKIVSGCMSGLKPAVVGLIGASLVSVGSTVFFPDGVSPSVFTDKSFYASAAVFILMSILAFKNIHPILIICLSAVIGIAAGYMFI